MYEHDAGSLVASPDAPAATSTRSGLDASLRPGRSFRAESKGRSTCLDAIERPRLADARRMPAAAAAASSQAMLGLPADRRYRARCSSRIAGGPWRKPPRPDLTRSQHIPFWPTGRHHCSAPCRGRDGAASQARLAGTARTFRGLHRSPSHVSAMGFDVLYFSPIHSDRQDQPQGAATMR